MMFKKSNCFLEMREIFHTKTFSKATLYRTIKRKKEETDVV